MPDKASLIRKRDFFKWCYSITALQPVITAFSYCSLFGLCLYCNHIELIQIPGETKQNKKNMGTSVP